MTKGSEAKANRQVARLRAALREREARVHELEQRLVALETSTTYQAGRLVAGAARMPRRRAARLPRDLYRLWKKRNAPTGSVTARENNDRIQLDHIDRPEDRLLAGGPYSGLVVAGVFAPRTLAALDGHAKLVPLYPHDARIVLDGADVDLLLVDSAAGEPGSPWTYLGVPGMYDRERVLADVLEIARGRDLPTVLWGADPPPTLAVIDWDFTLPAATPAALADLAARLDLTPVR